MPLETKPTNPSKDGDFRAEMPENTHQTATLTICENATSRAVASTDEPRKIRYRAKPRYSLPVQAKVIACDLDGTLVDSAADICTAVNRMRAVFGFGPLELVTVRNLIGQGVAHLVSQSMKSAVGELGATATKVAVAQFEKQYADCVAEQSRLFPQVREGLDAFHAKGFQLACITNKPARFTLPLLEALGIARDFGLVISGDSLPEKKPHPLPLQHTVRHFGVALEEVMMIGDSVHDAAAARAAGCPVFIVPYGYNQGQELRGLDCDAFIDDLPSALKYVRVVESF